MANVIQSNFRIRKNLGRVRKVIEVPNLIDIQKTSYDKFLQSNVPQNERQEVGLQAVFRSVFPIKDFNGTSELVFVSYNLEKPKYDVDECRQRGMTFAAPIKVTTQLMIYDTREGGERIVRDIKEQEVYFGEIPLMTDTGTFIINGTERVVVSQLHRSPGVFFDHDKGKTHSSGKLLYSARIIPYRGSWLDFEFDPKDIIYVRIDRRRKMHATVLLRALGYSTQDLLNYFYNTETVFLEKGGKYAKSVEYDLLAGQRATRDIKVGSEVIVKKNTKFTKAAIKKLQARRRSIACRSTSRSSSARSRRTTSSTRRPARSSSRSTRRSPRPSSRSSARRASTSFKILFIDGLNVGSLPARHAARREGEDDRRRDHGDLPPPPPGRSAHARDGEDALQQPVLQPRALRPLEGRPPQAELQVLPGPPGGSAPRARHARCSRRRTSSRRFVTSSS